MNIAKITEDIKDEFDMFDEWMDKYEHIISMGKELPIIEDKYRTEDYLVKGCQSQVWLVPKLEGDVIKYSSDSDAFITKGVVSIIADIFSGSTPKEIVESEVDLTTELDFGTILSGQRRNGAYNMLLKVKEYSKLWI